LICRRDSFITHRAFCDALAQESAREAPNLSSAISNQLYGNSNMSLGLSQIPSIHDQNPQSSDLLRFGGAPRTGQFDHILPPNMASAFRPSSHHTMQMQNPPFFMPESNQNQHYHDHQQGLISNKPFQGMIQLSDLNNTTPSASNLFNLPFLSTRGHTNYSEEQHFNTTEGSNFFTEGTIIGTTDHQTSSATAPSLFSTSLQHSTNMSHMSATALLQKAAQMGAASSSNNNNHSASSLLRSLASKSDHRPLISAANYSSILNSSVQEMMNLPGFEAYDHGMNKEPKQLSVGGSDRLTRDFLGVAQQQQQRGFNLSSLEAETNNAAPSGQSFGDGGNFQ